MSTVARFNYIDLNMEKRMKLYLSRQTCFIMVLTILSGCSQSAPSCSDSEATDLVTQIVTGEVEKQRQYFINLNSSNSGITFSVDVNNIRINEKNKDTGSFKCSATVDVKSNSQFVRSRQDIEYTTEITADNKPYVTVYGFK